MSGSIHGQKDYFIPDASPWPITAMLAVFLMLSGTALSINRVGFGTWMLIAGFVLLAFMFYGWFGDVIRESMADRYNAQVDRSFRQGMFWFIASEVFFFLSFFGALWYIRNVAMLWLGGEGYLGESHALLWSQFSAVWPSAGPEPLGGGVQPLGPSGPPPIQTPAPLSLLPPPRPPRPHHTSLSPLSLCTKQPPYHHCFVFAFH